VARLRSARGVHLILMEKRPGHSLLRRDEDTYDYELVVVSPLRVLQRIGISPDAVNAEELRRTAWLWERRPRKDFTHDRKTQTAFLVLTTILSWRGPVYATGGGVLGLAFFVLGFLSTCRQRHWCENYNAAITRLVASAGDKNRF
jgi:hypothetical protein